jgi:hypothetical protein
MHTLYKYIYIYMYVCMYSTTLNFQYCNTVTHNVSIYDNCMGAGDDSRNGLLGCSLLHVG